MVNWRSDKQDFYLDGIYTEETHENWSATSYKALQALTLSVPAFERESAFRCEIKVLKSIVHEKNCVVLFQSF